MDNTFMKEKPVLPLLLSMALPMVISMLNRAFKKNLRHTRNHFAFGSGMALSTRLLSKITPGKRYNAEHVPKRKLSG